MSNYLFDEFNPISPKEWKQKIQFDLQGADYNKTLLWQSEEGITVTPFYTKENQTNQEIKQTDEPFNICQSIFIDDEIVANTIAQKSLEKGVNAILFSSNTTFNYKKVLNNIDCKTTILYFNFHFFNADFIIELAKFINSKNAFFNVDIIYNLAKTGNWFVNLKSDHEKLKKLVSLTNNSLHVNASIYQNAGATIVQQLAYSLAHANEYLNYLGGDVAKKIHVTFSVGSNYFFEIAKLRAFRILWKSLLNEYEIDSDEVHLFVEPTLRNKTMYDYDVNIVRTTSECMSAIFGGANTILNTAYDEVFRKSNEFNQRIARDQLLILKEEYSLNGVEHLVKGSYYIETVTMQLAEKALDVFKQIEKGGGFLKQLKEGVIQRKIEESATKEQQKFDSDNLSLFSSTAIREGKGRIKEHLELFPFMKNRPKKTLIQPIISKRLSEKVEQERLKNE